MMTMQIQVGIQYVYTPHVSELRSYLLATKIWQNLNALHFHSAHHFETL